MATDKHLNTGDYEPQTYWEERAKNSQGNQYQAVCMFGISDLENASMERIQKKFLQSSLDGLSLEDSKVLEIGCGVGRWAKFFLEQDAFYHGVDISETMIATAQEANPKGNFKKIDTTSLPFPDNEMDIVFSLTVLHHNTYERQSEIINEMLRVVKPGGALLLMEGIGSKDNKSPFNMFPRSVEGWTSEVAKGGRAKLLRKAYIRWFILRDIASGLLKSFGFSSKSEFLGIRKLGTVLGYKLDSHLVPLLPKAFATNTVIVLEKTSDPSRI